MAKDDAKEAAAAAGDTRAQGAVRLRVAHLNGRGDNPFAVEPDAPTRRAMAADLGLSDLPAARLRGTLKAAPAGAWRLEAQLTARVVQPCVVTLAPVTTRIDEPVARLFSPHARDPEGDEVEMPDDEIEPLGTSIDLSAVLAEALALAVPAYPRAAGADTVAGADGGAQGTDPAPDPGTRRPFAGLADLLRGRAADGDGDGGDGGGD